MCVKITQEEFIRRCNIRHNNKYDYSKVVYVRSKDKVTVICPVHGPWNIVAGIHCHGNGCNSCGYETVSKKAKQRFKDLKPKRIQNFFDKAKKVHRNKYDYSKVNYVNNYTNVEIICSTHGNFYQQPSNHLNGQGCPFCVGKHRTTEDFIDMLREVHADKYDYSETEYLRLEDDVKIICPDHGPFYMKASNHLKGGDCIKCNNGRKSKKELEWLTSLNIPTLKYQYYIKLPDDYEYHRKNFIIADGYDPITNTIYEFDGDIWHGNPNIIDFQDGVNLINNKPYSDLHKETLERNKLYEYLGYNLVTVWEKDFDDSKKLFLTST